MPHDSAQTELDRNPFQLSDSMNLTFTDPASAASPPEPPQPTSLDQTNQRKVWKPLVTVPLILVLSGVGVLVYAIGTRYPGVIHVQWGIQGGQIMLDGRSPMQDTSGAD